MTLHSAVDPAPQSGAILTIDLMALRANYQLLQANVGRAEVAAVVKADAYGLGAVKIARALAEAGCRQFFVAELGEALELKSDLPTAVIFVLNGLHPGAESAAALHNIVPVLNSLEQIARWRDTAAVLGRFLPAAIQLDTGMARLGLSPEDAETLVEQPERLTGVEVRLVMSHLACADNPESGVSVIQAAAFAGFANGFPGVPRSLDNSGGALLDHDHFDVVRAGIALYGGAPHVGNAHPLKPVVGLHARIIQVRTLAAGAGLGYGLEAAAPTPRRIATIAAGYADGWPRSLSNRGSAFVRGRRVPIVGRVSMDSMTLDVTGIDVDHIRPGAFVELLGPNQSIDDVAADAGTIAYEILTRLGSRYRREYGPASGSTARPSA